MPTKNKVSIIDVRKMKEHIHMRATVECIECSRMEGSFLYNELEFAKVILSQNFTYNELGGWIYFDDDNYDIEGPLCPNCQNLYDSNYDHK